MPRTPTGASIEPMTEPPASGAPRPRRQSTPRSADPADRRRAEWLPPTGLIALSLVPIVAGAFRLRSLTSGAAITADNVRFFESPAPVVIHIVASSLFLVLGALQFVPSLRRRRWHRFAGRVVAPAGLLSALSALWMTLFYDIPEPSGLALAAMRVGFGSVMAVGIVVAFAAIRRGDVRTHSAWMTRAYAIGLGAGTQVFTFLPWTLLFGAPGQVMHAVLMGAGWAINLAVAEVVIRRRARRDRLRGSPRARSTTARAHLS